MSTPSLPRSTLVELFFEAVETHRGRVALQRMVSERALEDITYEQVLATVKLVTAALLEHGIERGDRVPILSDHFIEGHEVIETDCGEKADKATVALDDL